MRIWLLITGLIVCIAQAMADPLVRVETRLQPEPPYQTGSTLRLEVDLLTSTWFTQAPQPPALNLPGMLITPPNGQALSLTETIDGTPYFGLRLTYFISPTQAGQFSIPALPFSLRLGQASSPVEVSTQPLAFNVTGADSSTVHGTQLVARQVRMEQTLDYSAEPLKVGDRLIRRIQIQADDAQAMLIPPTDFTDLPGLKRYPQPAQVSALGNGRGSIDGGQRIDSVSYVVEGAGSYTLPAIELRWRDSHSQQERISSVPAIEFTAESGSLFKLPFSLEADLQKLGRGRLIKVSRPLLVVIGSLILLGAIGYLMRDWLSAQRSRLLQWRNRRRQIWLDSEACAWQDLQVALRHGALPLAELYRWQSRSQGQTDLHQLAEQLSPDARTVLQDAMAAQFQADHAIQCSNLILRNGLQQLRKSQRQMTHRQSRRLALPPLRPWQSRP